MSLESKIETLTAALEANTKALLEILSSSGGSSEPVAKPAKKEAPEPEEPKIVKIKTKAPKKEAPAPEETEEVEEETETSEVPELDDIRTAVRALYEAKPNGKAEWARIRGEHKIDNIVELDDAGKVKILGDIQAATA